MADPDRPIPRRNLLLLFPKPPAEDAPPPAAAAENVTRREFMATAAVAAGATAVSPGLLPAGMASLTTGAASLAAEAELTTILTQYYGLADTILRKFGGDIAQAWLNVRGKKTPLDFWEFAYEWIINEISDNDPDRIAMTMADGTKRYGPDYKPLLERILASPEVGRLHALNRQINTNPLMTLPDGNNTGMLTRGEAICEHAAERHWSAMSDLADEIYDREVPSRQQQEEKAPDDKPQKSTTGPYLSDDTRTAVEAMKRGGPEHESWKEAIGRNLKKDKKR